MRTVTTAMVQRNLHVCGSAKRVDTNTVRTCTRLNHDDPAHVHERNGHRVVWEDVNPDRPADCTCTGWHTDDADLAVSTLRILRDAEQCPAEQRALARIILAAGGAL
jgi:hypothetical protein